MSNELEEFLELCGQALGLEDPDGEVVLEIIGSRQRSKHAVDQNWLNMCVTAAIMHVEKFELGSAESKKGYLQVAQLETLLASIHDAHTVEGAVSRIGAVTAFTRAGVPERAKQLAELYLQDPLPPQTRDALMGLLSELASVPSVN